MARSLMAEFSSLCVSKESRQDRESEKMTQFLILPGFCSKVVFSFSRAALIAKASAS